MSKVPSAPRPKTDSPVATWLVALGLPLIGLALGLAFRAPVAPQDDAGLSPHDTSSLSAPAGAHLNATSGATLRTTDVAR